jgi:hypothetical protein
MQITRTRPKLAVTADGTGMVAHAGTRLLADLADATGLTQAFSDALILIAGAVAFGSAALAARLRRPGHR